MNLRPPDNLPAAPVNPDQEFTAPGTSFAAVYQMAAGLTASFAALDPDKGAVCLASEDRAVLAAALLAGLCGGPPLLLPHALSPKVLQQMQTDIGYQAAICNPLSPLPAALTADTAILWPADESGNTERLAFIPAPDRELVHLFTGGSTGSPRIWSKSGRNLLAEAAFLVNYFSISEQDIIVATISPCHIYGLLFSVLIPLLSSATVVAATPSFPAEIAEAVAENQATILAAVPAHYRALQEQTVSRGSLRFAVSSAGMLDQEDNRIFTTRNRTAITEVYGSTETGGIASRNRAAGEENFTPFPDVDWQIREERLLVRSPYISTHTKRDSNGYFLTGDRVQASADNSFQLLGRVDGISKVAGKRVDLSEIQEVIRRQPGVADCFVLTLPAAGSRENCIAALIQAAEPDRIDRDSLTRSLRDHLEPHALPRILRWTETIPMTGAGKYNLTAIRQILQP